MLAELLLPAVPGLCLDQVLADKDLITVRMTSSQPSADCPLCKTPSRRVHSRYQRTVADLPWAGTAVRMILSVRRFFCDDPACARKIFTERLGLEIVPYARRTERLETHLREFGMALGGEAGARLSHKSSVRSSPDTLLNLIRRAPLPEYPTPRVLGVDDWALRKGMRYGTILVDLETGQIVDLLPDRAQDDVAAWLQQHPGVEIVTRDRAEAYAEGIRQGAPQALQIADRWHLLKNLADALHATLVRHADLVDPLRKEGPTPDNTAASHVMVSPETERGSEPTEASLAATPTAADQRRQTRHREAHRLAELGLTQRHIAQRLGVCPKTVRRYLRVSTVQPLKRRNRRTKLAPYKDYVRQRIQDGCENAAALYREIRGQGYAGCITQVAAFVAPLRSARKSGQPGSPATEAHTYRDLVFAMLRAPQKSTDAQLALRSRLEQAPEPVRSACTLGREFAEIIRERRAHDLTAWMERVQGSTFPDLRRFVRGLRRDESAVRHACRYEWSNGPTEGHVNRLKFVKRSMYGRANFDLLRRRVLLGT